MRLAAIGTPVALLGGLLASCATVGLVSVPDGEPAERSGLRPEHRIFYDAFEGQGDWVLVEPFGWTFRPDVGFVGWRPYRHGFWTWNDWYGWVWVSEEPFGWATYHYGRWLYDTYHGWVWIPGSQWGPAWVAWAENEDYIGWAALPPSGGYDPQAPYPQGVPQVNGWSFVAARDLPGPNLAGRLADGERATSLLAEARPVARMVERDGHPLNLGPAVEAVERAAGGPIQRTEIREAEVVGRAGRIKAASERTAAENIRRAGEDAARVATKLSQSKASAPAAVELPRVSSTARRAPKSANVARDSLARGGAKER